MTGFPGISRSWEYSPASEDDDLPKAAAKLAWKPEDDKEAAN